MAGGPDHNDPGHQQPKTNKLPYHIHQRYNTTTNIQQYYGGVSVATTKAEETYAALTRLVDGGMRLSDAVRQLAAETGRKESAIRASYYQQRSKLGESSPGRGSRGPVSVEDAIREARELLERALAGIDTELAAVKADLDTARERYETLKASAGERKAELERKIGAL